VNVLQSYCVEYRSQHGTGHICVVRIVEIEHRHTGKYGERTLSGTKGLVLIMTDVRPIDANALKVLFDKRYDSTFMQMHTRDNKEYWNGVCAGINWGRNAISEAHIINHVDCRPHGHWMTHNNGTTECSECHTLGSPQWKCCPVCTAMMDGKENEDAQLRN